MIGYYVHHHGRGHATRALTISAHLDEPVVFFSSMPCPAGVRPQDSWVLLPIDVPEDGAPVADGTAHGRLHWAPLGVAGLAQRAARLLDEVVRRGLRRVVIDVSVEVALLVRVAGVPVTVLAMPGDRDDDVHRLAYDIADQIIAPWSADVYRPAWLDRHAGRTHFVGAISRFDGVTRPPDADAAGRRAVLLAGAGGCGAPADALDQLAAATPGWEWTGAGGRSGWVDDLWPLLAGADLVVTHAGQNAVADVASARARAVVIPEPRPYDEQRATAVALDAAGIAVAAPCWPAAGDWAPLLSRAQQLDPRGWARCEVAGAAARAAAVIAA